MLTDDEYARLPRLFHLDEFQGCLLQSGALYCVGSFHVRPLHEPHPTYQLMQAYSSDPHNFNRTLIHRGYWRYCVSARCPSLRELNPSRYFERCVAQLARRHNLRASLTHDLTLKDLSGSIQTRHHVFLYAIIVIIALNMIGTVYDLAMKGNVKKRKMLASWSLVSNWQELMGPHPDGDPRLAALLPVEGFRVTMILLVMFTHAGVMHVMLFLQKPKYVEEVTDWLATSVLTYLLAVSVTLMVDIPFQKFYSALIS